MIKQDLEIRETKMALTPDEAADFERDGILVTESGLAEATLSGILKELRELPKSMSDQYVNGRLQDAWMRSPSVRAAATDPAILLKLKQLYNAVPKPFQTLNFPVGTEQRAHADSIHFNSEPFGMMCGVWLALEDIGPEQGPLIYYPGSQRLPEMNFDDMGLKPSYELYSKYEDYIESKIEENGFTPKLGLIKKGQIIIWAANVLHGGAPHTNKNLTRKSQVTHYYFADTKYWRPGFSVRARAYFEPNWIPGLDAPMRSELGRLVTKVSNVVKRNLTK